MAKPCDPKETGIWEHFQLNPDKAGSPDLKGELQFTVDANGKIKGSRYEPDVATGMRKEPFEGLCKAIAGGGPEMMIFQMIVDNTLYFFSGIVTPVPGVGGTVKGFYYVALKIGTAPTAVGATAVMADPGDTGGWGGSQGGA